MSQRSQATRLAGHQLDSQQVPQCHQRLNTVARPGSTHQISHPSTPDQPESSHRERNGLSRRSNAAFSVELLTRPSPYHCLDGVWLSGSMGLAVCPSALLHDACSMRSPGSPARFSSWVECPRSRGCHASIGSLQIGHGVPMARGRSACRVRWCRMPYALCGMVSASCGLCSCCCVCRACGQ